MASVWQTIQTWVFEILHRVRVTYYDRVYPLHAAIRDNNFFRLKNLLESGQHDINAFDYDGDTPLKVAVTEGRSPKMVELLIQHDADLPLRDEFGFTAVHEAAGMWFKSLLKLKLLLDNGGSPNNLTTFSTPLKSAVCENSLDAVKTLLDAGAALNSPVQTAAWMARQDSEMVKLFTDEIERRANPPTLFNLCKTAIRREFGCVRLHRKIDQLPLPRIFNDDLKTATGIVIFERKPEF